MTIIPDNQHPGLRALIWRDDRLEVLDQRRLPDQALYDCYDSVEGVADAIYSMRVRGAPAIGIAAAYGAVLAARRRVAGHDADWHAGLEQDFELLAAARPTAVNLHWALARARQLLAAVRPAREDVVARLLELAHTLHAEDLAANLAMGAAGADVIQGACGVLTHCNTGSLATGGHGTALGVIRTAWQRQQLQAVYATETRPWMQGARLTVWELAQDGIPVTLLADSAAAWLMRSGRIQWVIVGADRIAANGDTANKIGTYALAVLARQHGVRFMVVAPSSTLDAATSSGDAIVIEERDPSELLLPAYQHDDSLVSAWNPVFDVTPAELIDAIVTERGVVLHPDAQRMQALLA
ncbi:MAG: hypothetical protein RIQ52_728 [Pseudomonadota bacterium]|jgi:methylthioribose-1-phosphate isomerase